MLILRVFSSLNALYAYLRKETTRYSLDNQATSLEMETTLGSTVLRFQFHELRSTNASVIQSHFQGCLIETVLSSLK